MSEKLTMFYLSLKFDKTGYQKLRKKKTDRVNFKPFLYSLGVFPWTKIWVNRIMNGIQTPCDECGWASTL